MVYCVKCGAKNPDDAKTCSQCGAPLYSLEAVEKPRRVEKECFGTRMGVEPRERVEEECFGIPRGGAVMGLAIGLIIILAGLSFLFQELVALCYHTLRHTNNHRSPLRLTPYIINPQFYFNPQRNLQALQIRQ
jgi:ribosomal protein L40E